MPLSNFLIETMRQTGRSRVGFLSENTSRIQVRSVVSSSFATLWTVALQAPLSMGFSGREYWSGLPRPPPGRGCIYLSFAVSLIFPPALLCFSLRSAKGPSPHSVPPPRFRCKCDAYSALQAAYLCTPASAWKDFPHSSWAWNQLRF